MVANSALLAGHVSVGSHTFIGGGAVFHQFVRIGDHCMVQGNGSLGKDLPHFCVMQRVNRMTGLNVIGLKRAGFSSAERAEIKSAFDLIFRSGRNLSQALAVVREKTWTPKAEKFIQFIEVPQASSARGLKRRAMSYALPGKGSSNGYVFESAMVCWFRNWAFTINHTRMLQMSM